jgi:hypothetical protein
LVRNSDSLRLSFFSHPALFQGGLFIGRFSFDCEIEFPADFNEKYKEWHDQAKDEPNVNAFQISCLRQSGIDALKD